MGITPSAMRRQHWLATTTASRTLFASVYGTELGVLAHNREGKRVPVRYEAATAVCNTPLQWTITCYAVCRDHTGGEYLRSTGVPMPRPVKQSAIHKALSTFHFNWMQSDVNKSHLLTLAWIATVGPEPSDEVAAMVFAGMGAWRDFDRVKLLPDGGYLTNPKE